MTVIEIIWKLSSLIIAIFLLFELIVVSPILILLYSIFKVSVYIAPDVFTKQSPIYTKSRKILLCIDQTSLPCFIWFTKQFKIFYNDELILIHVIDPTESLKILNDLLSFTSDDIDIKDKFIPQYLAEMCIWIQNNNINYTGILKKPYLKCNVAETILKFAQINNVDCIVVGASERNGT